MYTFWSERSDPNLQLADDGSKKNSTDEWTLDETSFKTVLEKFQVTPDLDTFASYENKKCDRFYAKIPELGCEAVDFFLQTLYSDIVYWVCPPVCHIIRAWRTITKQKDLTVIFVVPYWRSHTFYAEFLDQDHFKNCVVDHLIFPASFISKSESCLFNGTTSFNTLAMLIKT